MLKKYLCLLLAVAMLVGAQAEEMLTAEEIASQRAHNIVRALFMAAAGTTQEAEEEIRKELAEEEILARNAELAEYRRGTLPWLMTVLQPEEELPELSEELLPVDAAPSPTPEPSPTSMPEATIDPEAEPVWTPDVSYALFQTTETGRAYLELLESKDAAGCLGETMSACRLWMSEVDHAALDEMNSDYACWLYAADTLIDYPVVQAEDNDKYLHHMFNGAYNSCGTIFIDYRNLPDFQDPNTLMYGHHMRDGSMFRSIAYYREQSYYEAHPWMLLMSEGRIDLVEIFAGYITNDRDHCYDIAISDEKDLVRFVEEAERKSDFETTVEVMPGDKLVTLSTCAYAFENARYIAIGRLTEIWRAEPEVEHDGT